VIEDEKMNGGMEVGIGVRGRMERERGGKEGN
jgi:hypothetical protein